MLQSIVHNYNSINFHVAILLNALEELATRISRVTDSLHSMHGDCVSIALRAAKLIGSGFEVNKTILITVKIIKKNLQLLDDELIILSWTIDSKAQQEW